MRPELIELLEAALGGRAKDIIHAAQSAGFSRADIDLACRRTRGASAMELATGNRPRRVAGSA